MVLTVFLTSRISPFASAVIFFRQISGRDGRGHLGDIAHLTGEIAGHKVHAFGEILPGAGHPFDFGLAAELAFGAHLARHTRDLGGKGIELSHHGIDGLGGPQELSGQRTAIDIERHRLIQITLGHRPDDSCNFARRLHQIDHQRVHRIDAGSPGSQEAVAGGALVRLAFFADYRADPVDLLCQAFVPIEHII